MKYGVELKAFSTSIFLDTIYSVTLILVNSGGLGSSLSGSVLKSILTENISRTGQSLN